MMSQTRFLVGIDLGTTHTVVAYCDLTQYKQNHQIAIWPIPQFTTAGQLISNELFPSCRYHPSINEYNTEDNQYPWPKSTTNNDIEDVILGPWSQELGAKVSQRLVVSAKSWLTHSGVDRLAPILPWGAATEIPKISPVIAQASYLVHIRAAWDYHWPDYPLAKQQIVITVPASFANDACELTIMAAKIAGLPNISLLEEPQAACYYWYWQQQTCHINQIADAPILVCDIGGGTCDFSLFNSKIDPSQSLTLKRISVGNHILLGGDNMDLAIAHFIEQKLNPKQPLTTSQWTQLLQQCRSAKEKLLSDNAPEEVNITLLAQGSSLLKNATTIKLNQKDIAHLILEGFFPLVSPDSKIENQRSGVTSFGLPYAQDAAITRHLAHFLQQHLPAELQSLKKINVLYHGGIFNSGIIRNKIQEILDQWFAEPTNVLSNTQPNTGVALGAVVYLLAKQGIIHQIKSGSPRSYFIKILDPITNSAQGLCILPRDTDVKTQLTVPNHRFLLRVGNPVQFEIIASNEQVEYPIGTLIPWPEHTSNNFVNWQNLPPCLANLPVKQQLSEIPVQLVAEYNEQGMLTMLCQAESNPDLTWQVTWQLSAQQKTVINETEPKKTATSISTSSIDSVLPKQMPQALELIEKAFGKAKKTKPNQKPNQHKATNTIKQLRHQLEQYLGPREEWSIIVLRTLADSLLNFRNNRRRTSDHERLWFTLCGFCLRPGYGTQQDAERIQLLWPLYQANIQYKISQNWSSWWTFWRRVSGGLSPKQQQTISAQIIPWLAPSIQKQRAKKAQLANMAVDDMLRLAASLEHISVAEKEKLGQWLFQKLQKNSDSAISWWVLGRIANRIPFYGSAHQVIGIDHITQWLEIFWQQDWRKLPTIALAAVLMTRYCGDRSRDVPDPIREQVKQKLKTSKSPSRWLQLLEEPNNIGTSDLDQMYGDSLPLGLTLIT